MNGDRAINIKYRFDYGDLTRGVTQASQELDRTGQQVRRQMQEIEQSLEKIGAQGVRQGREIGKTLEQASQDGKQAVQELGDEGKSQAEELSAAFENVGEAIAGAFAVSQIKDFISQVTKVRGEYQQLEVAFETMLGSKKKADALMSQLIKTAATTPFGMNDISNSAKQLLAYGLEAEKVNDTLIRLGDIAAGLSIPINDLAYLYGTTMVQGRLYTQDLNQFLNRGIPLVEELAKQFNVAESEVKKLVEEGRVGFPEVQQAIEAMTEQGSKFGGLMEKQSKTIAGQISNIEDTIEQMFNDIGKSSEGIISSVLGTVSDLAEHWREIGTAIATVAVAYGTYKATLLVVMAVERISQGIRWINNRLIQEAIVQKHLAAMANVTLSNTEAMAAAKTVLFSRALHALKVAIMTNPIGILAGVLATIAGALVLSASGTDELAEATENEKKRVQELIDVEARAKRQAESLDAMRQQETKTLENTRAQLELNKQKLKEFNGTKEEEKKIVNEMNNTYGDTMGYFNSVHDWYNALIENSAAYCQQMIIEARTRRLANQIAEAEQQKHDIIYDDQGKKRLYSTKNKLEYYKSDPDPMYGTTTTGQREVPNSSDWHKANESFAQLNGHIASLEKQMQDAAAEAAKLIIPVKGSNKPTGDGGGGRKRKTQEQIDQEIAERQQAIREYARQIILANTEAELEIEQERIKQLGDGFEKTRRQIDLNYRKLIIENKDRELEMITELAKARLNAWLNLNPEATKEQQIAYMESMLDPESATRLLRKDLDAGQQATLQAYDELAEQYRDRARKLMELTNQDAMDEYLREYGTLQERIDAINRIYQQKADAAKSQGERMSITREWNDALNEVNFKEFMTNRAALAFGEVDRLSKETIDELIADMEKYRSKIVATFDPDKISKYEEALQRLKRAQALNAKNPFSSFVPDYFRERAAAEAELRAAEQTSNELTAQKAQKEQEVADKIEDIIKKVKELTGVELTAAQVKDGNTLDEIIDKLRTQGNTTGASTIQTETNALGDLRSQLGSVTEASDQAASSYSSLLSQFGANFSGATGSLAGVDAIVHKINENVQSAAALMRDLKDTANALGADTEVGSDWDKASTMMDAFAEASQGATNAFEAFKSGNAMGVIQGVAQSFTAWIRGFAAIHDAGNERRIRNLQKEIEDLDRQNKRLDRQLQRQYSKEARDTNEEKIKDAERQIALIERQIAEEQDKKNSDSDRIQEWRDKIEELQNDIEDYKEAAIDAIIGEDIASSIDNFAEALVSAWGKAGEQARNIKDLVKTMLKQMVMEAMKTDLSAPITNLRKMMADALEDGVVTINEKQAIEDYAKDIAKYIDQRYEWASDILKDTTGSGQAGGERGGFATASQDSVEELSGRAAAIHTTLEMSRQILIGMSMDIGSFRKELETQREIATETRNLQLIAVGHLEDISRNTRELYQINERLGKIEINTRGL